MKTNWRRLLVLIPSLLVLVIMAWFFQAIFIYLVIAAVIALIGRPILQLLDRVKIKSYDLPEAVKAVVTMLLLLGIAGGIFSFFIPRLLRQTQKLEQVNVEAISRSLEEPISRIEDFIQTYDLTGGASVEEYFRTNVIKVVNSVQVSSFANAIVGFTGDLFIAIFSILFITFFFLKERTLLHSMIMSLTPDEYTEGVDNIINSIRKLLTRYFIGVVLEVLLVGGLISIGLTILGVEDAFVIGVFAGLFNVIPYLGPIIGAVMGISLIILTNLQLEFYSQMIPLILKVMVVFVVVQLIDNFVFQPFIYSSSVKAHPLEIFLVILMAGSLAGVGGMIIAIPVYTIFRVVAKEFFSQLKLIKNLTRGM
jgi:predicted PurR-regulated permease PerM